MSVLGHVSLGNAGRSIALRGDSVTALTWAITKRPRGSLVTNAATIWTLLCIAADIHVSEITHLPGADNDRCDQLSRRGPKPTLSLAEHAITLGLGTAPEISLEDDTDASTLLRLCQPSVPTDTDTDFIALWGLAQSSIDSFLSRYPSLP